MDALRALAPDRPTLVRGGDQVSYCLEQTAQEPRARREDRHIEKGTVGEPARTRHVSRPVLRTNVGLSVQLPTCVCTTAGNGSRGTSLRHNIYLIVYTVLATTY